MRDIIPPKNFKPRVTDTEKIEEMSQTSFKIPQGRKTRKISKVLLFFFFLVILSGIGAASYYFLYLKPANDSNQAKNEPKQEEQGDPEIKDIKKSISDLSESVDKIDEDNNDLEAPTLDLNVTF